MTSVPPRFGVCATAPPAPETARSETAIAAARLAVEPPVLRVPQRLSGGSTIAATVFGAITFGD